MQWYAQSSHMSTAEQVDTGKEADVLHKQYHRDLLSHNSALVLQVLRSA